MEWYRLLLAGVNNKIIKVLMDNFISFDEMFQRDLNDLHNKFGISIEDIEKIQSSRNIELEKYISELKEKNIRLISIKDDIYPEDLKNIAQPPVFMHYKGNINLLKGKKIAVVGTRKCSTYGKLVCERIVEELALAKITTVSGLALGIDEICHRVTLDNGGNTIAVVGSGLDVVYPKKNIKLWEQISKEGLVLSEFPLKTKPFAYNFPLRNRIIAGLSLGVLLIESRKKGGSLITAEIALEEGRDVFAVPGDIYSATSEGTNNLIKNSSAKLVTKASDILVEYGLKSVKKKDSKKLSLTDEEYKIYNVLEREKSFDEIIQKISMDPGEALSTLMELEVKKIICSIPGGKYRRKL